MDAILDHPDNIDHLVFAAPDLETGRDVIEERLGVRPVPGGRHPAWGTHNALLALGPAVYLEVVAPDPSVERPPRGRLFGLDEIRRPELRTWAIREEDILDFARRAAASGIGPIEPGRRETPDGTVLSWQLSDPYAMPLGGAVPFVIAWGETPHPATAIPVGGELVGFALRHPDPLAVRRALEPMGLALEVSAADEIELVATIRTPSGPVELR